MLPYWAMFLALAIPAMTARIHPRRSSALPWLALAAVFTVLIGYRYQVGGDWGNYLRHFEQARFQDFADILTRSDPGYAYLNWLAQRWGLEVYFVNLVSGAIFMTGLVAFARRQPYPWLVLAVAFPYLVMVVAMGYTRQAASIGFILLSLNALESRQFLRYLLFIALATLFHRTALVMIPLGFFIWGRGWIFRAIALVAAAYVLYDLLVAEETEKLWRAYVDSAMQSQGARIRVLMNLVPSLILLAYWKKWRSVFPDYWFWFWIAVGAVAAVPLVAVASTAVDRISLYFLPIQLVVFSRLPYLLRERVSPDLVKAGIVAGYALVLYVWLNYAAHAYAWVPYRNALFM